MPGIGITAPPAPPFKLDPGLALIQTPNGSTIFAEIADTTEKRSRGLMFRTSMAPDRGMLFTFSEPGKLIFWMKNTKMKLDMLWLDKKGTIVHIEQEVPICERRDNLCPRYRSTISANYVLELKNGQTKKLELQKGNRLTIQLPE
ncbi:MAG: DUF192 domain-containing protein [Nitrospirota bacterium]|nr:DUF192 domain-containing protein [Nitrospirota bacterium]